MDDDEKNLIALYEHAGIKKVFEYGYQTGVQHERFAIVDFIESQCQKDDCGLNDEAGNCDTCKMAMRIENGEHES